MASHLRRFLVQLRAGLCAAHVRGVEAIGRLMSALAKVRRPLAADWVQRVRYLGAEGWVLGCGGKPPV